MFRPPLLDTGRDHGRSSLGAAVDDIRKASISSGSRTRSKHIHSGYINDQKRKKKKHNGRAMADDV